MQKFLLIFLMPALFIACRTKRVPPAVIHLPAVANDTFLAGYAERLHSYTFECPEGFIYETVNYHNRKDQRREYLSIPAVKGDSARGLNIRLKEKALQLKNRFIREDGEPGKEEGTGKTIPNEINMFPVAIYRDTNLVSCCFEICYSDTVLMRPYCHYDCLNYNSALKKEIRFTDFFNLQSAEDSLYVRQLILAAVGERNFGKEMRLDDRLDFSVDADYIFFYFDAYEMSAPFNTAGGIKRQYLKKYIKKPYQ